MAAAMGRVWMFWCLEARCHQAFHIPLQGSGSGFQGTIDPKLINKRGGPLQLRGPVVSTA